LTNEQVKERTLPRVELITGDADVSPDRKAEVDAITATLGHLSGPFAVLMYSPGLAQKVMEAGAHIRLRSTLLKWQRELAILVTAKEKGSDFEWASHAGVGRQAGLREEVIEVVRHGREVAGLEPDEADIVSFARELVSTNAVGQSVFDSLLGRHDVRWLVELTATIGQYQYIAAVLGAFDVQPPAGRERIAAGQGQGW
jgi:4-carboxymuconolactone decarboxylase